jgi:hypothetical protein
MAYREALATTAYRYAGLSTLYLKPSDKVGTYPADSRYISYSLSQHIRAAAKYEEEIQKLVWENPDQTDEDLKRVVGARSLIALYHLNSLGIVRGEFEERRDNDPKDWFLPFVLSMSIWREDMHRSKLSLPRLCPNYMLPMQHGGFFNIVLKAYEQPLFEWERTYNVVHAEVS